MSTDSSPEATAAASEATKSLIRTVVRTFFNQPKQILILDALLTYNVLHIEDIATLFHTSNTQQKEIRSLINPLKAARLVTTGTRSETKTGNTRAVQREYYYVNWHEAVDSIKYKIIKLLERVKDQYKENDSARKDWFCPRCKAEYDEFAILDSIDPERGFICARCGYTLVQNEAAVQERAEHAKIRLLNDQLRPFNELLGKIDAASIPANNFDEAWARKREVPKDLIVGQQGRQVWTTVERQRIEDEKRARQETVKGENLDVSIKGERERRAEEEEAKRIKAGIVAKQNVLPEWHTKSAIGMAGLKKDKDDGTGDVSPFRPADGDDKKNPAITEQSKVDEDLDDFVAQYEREQQLLAAKEAERSEGSDDEEDEEDEDDFEDVATPASSQHPPSTKFGTPVKSMNGGGGSGIGLKREFDLDGESVSGTSTGGRTPVDSGVTSMPSAKRVRIDQGDVDGGQNGAAVGAGMNGNGDGNAADADSEEDEDFEDV